MHNAQTQSKRPFHSIQVLIIFQRQYSLPKNRTHNYARVYSMDIVESSECGTLANGTALDHTSRTIIACCLVEEMAFKWHRQRAHMNYLYDVFLLSIHLQLSIVAITPYFRAFKEQTCFGNEAIRPGRVCMRDRRYDIRNLVYVVFLEFAVNFFFASETHHSTPSTYV